MNIQKLKKYNQTVLAVIGTITLIFIIGLSCFFIYEVLSYSSYDDAIYDTSIISKEVTDSLVHKEEVKKQIITLSDFNLIDSTEATYILPVRQKNLGEDEYLDDSLLGLINTSGSGKSSTSRRSNNGVSYNNLILFDSHLSNPKILFQEKISISNYYKFTYKDSDFILIKLTKDDTNNDNVLNSYDMQELAIFDLSKNSFIDITSNAKISFINFAKNVHHNELVFEYGEDRNGNGEFEKRYEPKSYYRLDMDSGELLPVLSQKSLKNLQGLLEGSIDE